MRILKGLSSRVLPCGCVAGIYETYDGVIVAVIDAVGSACGDEHHEGGKIVPTGPEDLAIAVRSTSSTPR